jgi:hypothetical protein
VEIAGAGRLAGGFVVLVADKAGGICANAGDTAGRIGTIERTPTIEARNARDLRLLSMFVSSVSRYLSP